MLHKVGSQIKIEASSTELTDLIVEKSPATEHQVVDKKRNDFLYFRARAISAGDFGPKKGEPNPNGNGDYFPRAELEKAYQTFEGRNLFLNHESDHPIKSIGKVVSAEMIDDPETGEIYVECLSKIDKKLHPEIARKVETGELDTVSMGCSCEESMCSICGAKIHTDNDEKCAHLEPQGLLKTFNAEIDLPEYGIQRGKPMKAFAINTGLTFNELSIVNVPADASAFIKGVIASNIKVKITKQAKLDVTESLYLKELLNNLDDTTKTQIKAEFCGICPTSQEDEKMSEKVTSKGNEQDDMKEILKGLDAYQYHRLAESFEKKFKHEVVAEKPKHKKEEKEEKDEKEEKEEKPEKDEKEALLTTILEKAKKSVAGQVFAQTIRRLVETEGKKVETPKVEEKTLTAKFEKKENLKESTWTFVLPDKTTLAASLESIWGNELDTQDQEYIMSEQYGKDVLAFMETEGAEKTAELLGVAYKQMDVKDSKVTTPSKSEFKEPTNAKEEKAAEKSSEAMEEGKPASHLEPEKEILEAAAKKEEVKKAADIMDEVKPQPDEAPAETPAVEAPVESISPEGPTETPKSVFEAVDKVIVGDGYEAYKDHETGEVCIKDAQGQEVKRIPDAFGPDMAPVIDLLRALLDLPSAQEQKPAEESKPMEAPMAEPKPVAAPEGTEDASMYASKKETLTKEAQDLQKQKEAFEQEKRALEAQKAEIIAKQFSTSVNSRVAKCRKVVEAMIEREMLTIDEEAYIDRIDNGSTVIEAREAGLQHSINRQLEALLAMDETSLEAFEKSVARVQKKASKSLKTAVHMAYPEDNADELADIFNSMGSLKGRSINDFE